MLYLVATPIGHMGDITLRALETLKQADLIAAEDTRHTSKLLMHYDIKKPLVSYHEHNKKAQGKKLIKKLKEGINIALVTDAGTPGISDPGEDLVKLAIDNKIEVTMIPGPVAGIMGLVLSGFSSRSFVFEGFLPEDKKKRREILSLCKKERRTTVFYESPHNLLSALQEMKEYLGDRNICVCRELTKKFEETRRGTIDDLIGYYSEPKGEFVIIVEGNQAGDEKEEYSDQEIYKLVTANMQSGMKRNEALRYTSSITGISRNEIYAIVEKMKDTL